jgi:DNA ligase-1
MELLRPLLAAKTTDSDLQRLPYPMLLSPKIDGVRALVRNGVLVSRTMKPIPNLHTQALFGRDELEGMDGELVVGNPWDSNLMQNTMSGVMSRGGIPHVSFHVFDKWDVSKPFQERLVYAKVLAEQFEEFGVKFVEHQLTQTYLGVIWHESEYIQQGYEGVMLRSLNGPYKQNRSTLREAILLKVKRFEDAEATVIGYEPLYRNLNAQEKDERGYAKRSTHQANQSGTTFSIGSGFSEADRRLAWTEREKLVGRIVTYKTFKVTGVKDKPRFPIFKSFRDRMDVL